MAERVTDDDLDLLDELGVETAPAASGGRTPREQRIIAGFEEIERFVEEHGRVPQHGENRDIFERLYAVRLDQIRRSVECRDVLKGMDSHGLLESGEEVCTAAGENRALDDEELLASLGVEISPESDITQLVHVRARDEIKAAEEVAQRNLCEDFDQFKPLFEKVQRELETNKRRTVKYGDYADIKKGNLFILDGQKVLVAEMGDEFVAEYGRPDRRLRVVYDNGTESDLLLRSLQRALYKDKASRRITEPGFGLLFSDEEDETDLPTGYVYVLRSKSDHPFVVQHRKTIHKIGVTGGDVKKRIANAKKDPTYLLADVEIVAEYKLANVNRSALEGLLHKFFASARLDLELKDRFGSPVQPEEWFLVPVSVIDETIQKIKDGTISDFRYDPEKASLTQA
ncbi:MAG: GIY-YIG nuclease family protein [Planctomycetaceae bacterium]